VRSVGYGHGCICIRFIYGTHPILYKISNVLMFKYSPFLKHVLRKSSHDSLTAIIAVRNWLVCFSIALALRQRMTMSFYSWICFLKVTS